MVFVVSLKIGIANNLERFYLWINGICAKRDLIEKQEASPETEETEF